MWRVRIARAAIRLGSKSGAFSLRPWAVFAVVLGFCHTGAAQRTVVPATNLVAEAAPGPDRLTASRERPRPLAPPTDAAPLDTNRSRSSGSRASGSRSSGSQAVVTVLSSLALVIGAFALVAWFTRRSLPSGLQRLPKEVLQPLGRAPLDARQHLQLLRLGNKLILVSVSQGGSETLSEITEPAEVERLTGLCEESQPHSVSNSFRQVLSQLGREPAARGFLGSATSEFVPNGGQPSAKDRARLREDA